MSDEFNPLWGYLALALACGLAYMLRQRYLSSEHDEDEEYDRESGQRTKIRHGNL